MREDISTLILWLYVEECYIFWSLVCAPIGNDGSEESEKAGYLRTSFRLTLIILLKIIKNLVKSMIEKTIS